MVEMVATAFSWVDRDHEPKLKKKKKNKFNWLLNIQSS